MLAQAPAAIQVALGAVSELSQLVRELNALTVDARQFIGEANLTQQKALALVAAVEATRREAQSVADKARDTHSEAAASVAQVRAIVVEIEALIGRFSPALRKFAPVTEFVAAEITVDHAEAFTALIQSAPELVDKLTNDVVPVLDSLDTVGSDLREVMDTTQQMDEMLGAVPGLGRVKKRIEREQAPPKRPRSAAPPVTAPTEP